MNLWKPLELIQDPDGKLAHTRVLAIIAAGVFSYHMVHTAPIDPFMWLVYMGTIGGYSGARKLIEAKYAGGDSKPAA